MTVGCKYWFLANGFLYVTGAELELQLEFAKRDE